MYLKPSPPVLLKKSSPTRDRPDHEERLRPRYDRLREWGVRWVMSQVPLARKEPQERPALLGDVVADRAAQHGITRLERVQHRVPGDPAGHLERHLAFHLRQGAQVRREHDADHASVRTSTESTAGRSRTVAAQPAPASARAAPCPP